MRFVVSCLNLLCLRIVIMQMLAKDPTELTSTICGFSLLGEVFCDPVMLAHADVS